MVIQRGREEWGLCEGVWRLYRLVLWIMLRWWGDWSHILVVFHLVFCIRGGVPLIWLMVGIMYRILTWSLAVDIVRDPLQPGEEVRGEMDISLTIF